MTSINPDQHINPTIPTPVIPRFINVSVKVRHKGEAIHWNVTLGEKENGQRYLVSANPDPQIHPVLSTLVLHLNQCADERACKYLKNLKQAAFFIARDTFSDKLDTSI